jgi:periplasmic divalent cation tolerance protein
MNTRAAPAALVVLTTLGEAADARALIRRLLDARLIACGTLLAPGVSFYWWQGAVEEAAETVVLLKARADQWDALRAAIVAQHPYDVPEVLALPVVAGFAPYLEWMADATRPPEDAP